MEFFDQGNGQFVCQFIGQLPTTDTGKPFTLYDWQQAQLTQFYGQMLEEDGDVFRKFQYLYLEIPKKNGKSELAAALGLYHLFADGELNAEVYVVAADRANAGIVYGAAKFMVEQAPLTASMVADGRLKIVDSKKEIQFYRQATEANGFVTMKQIGVLKVLSSEAYSKHGYKPSCVIFDELHAQPNRDLWDIMTFGSGSSRLQPVYIVLTTAGDDPDRGSIGWEIHEKAVTVRDSRQLRQILDTGGDVRQVQTLRNVDVSDLSAAIENLLEQDFPEWYPVLYGFTALYGSDPDVLKNIDIYDESLWYQCNPSLGKHLKIRTLRNEARAAKKSEAAERLFRWLRLNQWISTKAVSWISLGIYDKCQWNGNVDDLNGLTCYGGVDLSTSRDLTAFVLLFPPQKGLDVAVVLWHIWRPASTVLEAETRDHVPYRDWERAGFLTLCDGDIIDYDDVFQRIRAATERYKVKMVGFDPYLSRTITQRLEPFVTVVEIPQDMKNMSPAMKEIGDGMLNRTHLHQHNTCARWSFGNMRVAVDGNENIKPMKNKSIGRIDPSVAMIIAQATWMVGRNQAPDLAEAVTAEYSM